MQKKILIICSKVNPKICKVLYETSIESLKQKGLDYKAVYIPGAFELPTALNLLHSEDFSGYVLLGCIVKSETQHFEYVSQEACRGIMDVSIKNDLAMGFGLITANSMEQAADRAIPYATAAVDACLAMINLKNRSLTLLEENFSEDTDL